MNETLWFDTNTPPHMIEYLNGDVSNRKLRLFACSACRRILQVMPFELCRKTVELCESYADGFASETELRSLADEVERQADSAEQLQIRGWNSVRTAAMAASKGAYTAAFRAAESASDADLVREHFGNPFRPVTIAAEVLTWNDSTIVHLARTAYEERLLPAGKLDNRRLLIIADALEEAGCGDEQILTHLRGGGNHYRGCWVVDLLLDKH